MYGIYHCGCTIFLIVKIGPSGKIPICKAMTRNTRLHTTPRHPTPINTIARHATSRHDTPGLDKWQQKESLSKYELLRTTFITFSRDFKGHLGWRNGFETNTVLSALFPGSFLYGLGAALFCRNIQITTLLSLRSLPYWILNWQRRILQPLMIY